MLRHHGGKKYDRAEIEGPNHRRHHRHPMQLGSSSIPKFGLRLVPFVFFLYLTAIVVVFVDASLGSMGFMKLKRVQGGFNGNVLDREGDLHQRRQILVSGRTKLLPEPSQTKTTTKEITTTTTSTPIRENEPPTSLATTTTSMETVPPSVEKILESTTQQQEEQLEFQRSPIFQKDLDWYRYNGRIVGTNAIGFLLSLVFRNMSSFQNKHYHVDLLGSGAFAIAALPHLFQAQDELSNYHREKQEEQSSRRRGGRRSRSKATTTISTTNRMTKIRIAAQQRIPSSVKSFFLIPEPSEEKEEATTSTAATAKRIQFTSWAVVLWSTKLAFYLLTRVVQNGGDSRLDMILNTPKFCAGFWFYSAVWGIVCGLPYSLGLTSTQSGTSSWLFPTGLACFVTGCIVETVADFQKWSFQQRQRRLRRQNDAVSNNSISQYPPFCNVGLWKYSQHPNWFGDLLLWTGLFLANAPSLVPPTTSSTTPLTTSTTPTNKSWRTQLHRTWRVCKRRGQQLWARYGRLVAAACGPIFLYRLFHQEATGEMMGDALQARNIKYGYGKNPEYTRYIDNTPLFVPKPLQLKVVSIGLASS